MTDRFTVLDGDHRMSSASVLVTPLMPPFTEPWRSFTFDYSDKELAVSLEDAEKITNLLSGDPYGRVIVLEREGNMIRISVGQ